MIYQNKKKKVTNWNNNEEKESEKEKIRLLDWSKKQGKERNQPRTIRKKEDVDRLDKTVEFL